MMMMMMGGRWGGEVIFWGPGECFAGRDRIGRRLVKATFTQRRHCHLLLLLFWVDFDIRRSFRMVGVFFQSYFREGEAA